MINDNNDESGNEFGGFKAIELYIKQNFSKNYLTPLILTNSFANLRISSVESKFSKTNPKIYYTVLYSIIQYYTPKSLKVLKNVNYDSFTGCGTSK